MLFWRFFIAVIPDLRESQKLSVMSRLREVATTALWESPCPIPSGVYNYFCQTTLLSWRSSTRLAQDLVVPKGSVFLFPFCVGCFPGSVNPSAIWPCCHLSSFFLQPLHVGRKWPHQYLTVVADLHFLPECIVSMMPPATSSVSAVVLNAHAPWHCSISGIPALKAEDIQGQLRFCCIMFG